MGKNVDNRNVEYYQRNPIDNNIIFYSIMIKTQIPCKYSPILRIYFKKNLNKF